MSRDFALSLDEFKEVYSRVPKLVVDGEKMEWFVDILGKIVPEHGEFLGKWLESGFFVK